MTTLPQQLKLIHDPETDKWKWETDRLESEEFDSRAVAIANFKAYLSYRKTPRKVAA